MDNASGDVRLKPTYEVLLTALCQTGLGSALGWALSVADPDAARIAVVTWALACGDPVVRPLAERLGQYVDHAMLQAPLSPLICCSSELARALHITISSSRLVDRMGGKDVLIWDSGKGSRMSSLLQTGQPKGDILVMGKHKLHHLATAAAQWSVNSLRELDRDYVAFVASDQILCLSEADRTELTTLLDAASQDADLIFFDGPPALSLARLRSLMSSAEQPRRNGVMALARDRLLLRDNGGAHIFQCVLVRRGLTRALVFALETILDAARNGCDVDYGVNEIAVLPRLIQPNWLKKDRRPAARRIHAALCELCAGMRRVRWVSMPLQVFNVNCPSVLRYVQTRIGGRPA